jgi:hypothetical protein
VLRRTALIRHTPLRPSKPNRRWVRDPEDKIPPELAAYIIARDEMCLAARLDPETHRCRTRFGTVHRADDPHFLRLAHVKDHARLGKRAEPDKWHLTLECDEANNEGWSSANRQRERDYIFEKEGPAPG